MEKLLRVKSGCTLPFPPSGIGLFYADDETYDNYMEAGLAEIACTNDRDTQIALLGTAARALGVTVAVHNEELGKQIKAYGAQVHLIKPKK